MSEPTSVTLNGRTFDVIHSSADGADRWKVTIDDTDHWLPPQGPPADAVLTFPGQTRTGRATLDRLDWLRQPFGTVHANLTVTVEQT